MLERKSESILSEEKLSERKRIYLLDEIRGLAVVAMVLYHVLFSAGEVFGYEPVHNIFKAVMPFEPIIPITFIFISGICTRLSRSNLRRGGMLFLIALAINIVTWFFVPQIVIRFGVINLLGVCMVLYGLCEKGVKRINCKAGFILSLLLFILTWGVSNQYIGILNLKFFKLPELLYRSEFLFPIGFRNAQFYSSDYFPLLPWFFMFLAGSFFWSAVRDKKLPDTLYKAHFTPLSKVGRYAAVIYIVHQPLIFAVLYAVDYIR